MSMRCIAICFALSLLSAPASADVVQAAKVNDFTNIFAVDGHISSWIVLYTDSPSAVVADAQYVGAKHWREGLGAQETGQIAVLQALVNAGISLIGIPLQNQAITTADHVTKAKAWAALGTNVLWALEGPNEPVNFPITYNGVSTGPAGNPTTFTPVAEFQKDYYTAIKADSVLQNVPVWSVTQVGAEPNNVGLQYLTIPAGPPSGVLEPAGTVYADVANMHVYPMFTGGAQTVDQTTDRLKQELYAGFSLTYHASFVGYTHAQADALPKVITEFGYAASGGTPNGSGVDTATQGKNLLTGFMNAWSEGYKLVDIYELYDEGDGFGIFTGHVTPKLAATYIHNFTTVISDSTSQSFVPGQLAFSFVGLPSTGMSTLFQKSNGNYELVLWNNVNNWNLAAGTPISISPTSVTVNFGSHASSIKLFDPMVGTAAVQSVSNMNTITVSLKDYPIVLEIVPYGGQGPCRNNAELDHQRATLTNGGSYTKCPRAPPLSHRT